VNEALAKQNIAMDAAAEALTAVLSSPHYQPITNVEQRAPTGTLVLSHTVYLLIGFGKSTPHKTVNLIF